MLTYHLTINVYLKSQPLTYIFAYTTVKNSIKVSDGLISIFFTIFIGIVICYLFGLSRCLVVLFINGYCLWFFNVCLIPHTLSGNFYVPCFYVFNHFVQANVVQATIRNSVWDFDLVYAYWYARLPIQNVHQLPSQSTKSTATELLNGTKPLQQHVPYRQFVWAHDMLHQPDPHYWLQVL